MIIACRPEISISVLRIQVNPKVSHNVKCNVDFIGSRDVFLS